MLKIPNSKWIHIIGVAIMLYLIIAFFLFLLRRVGTNRLANVMFSFLIAGATCSLIDKVCWNGSLDYILLKGMFTFDLKDLYIDVFIGLVVIGIIVKHPMFDRLEEKGFWKRFGRFLIRKEEKE